MLRQMFQQIFSIKGSALLCIVWLLCKRRTRQCQNPDVKTRLNKEKGFFGKAHTCLKKCYSTLLNLGYSKQGFRKT